ncbi:hypothetical protein JIR001_05730 [Polycladomyces abyssicola]|uniref:Uncharacterized protein n=1 Tax=Polycladomyces abyssicola TaxID=1125966 RepID=A0A8D5ZLN3_9BACL|nr:hypothetical protein JIR001_05730 [Polycladomyces abyssicola]
MSKERKLFHRKHEPDVSYPNIFRWLNWEEASFDERLRALQLLENDHASRQGRTSSVPF